MARAFSADIFVSWFLPDMFKFVTDSVRVKRVISTKEFVLPFECGANNKSALGRGRSENSFCPDEVDWRAVTLSPWICTGGGLELGEVRVLFSIFFFSS